MAREACVLGKVCIYTNGHTMRANSQFIESSAMLKAETLEQVFPLIGKLTESDYIDTVKEKMEKLVRTEFEDTNRVLISQIQILESKLHN
jgi:hypothetical protein